jgi:hypothetical protein
MPKGLRIIHFSFSEKNITHYGGLFLIHSFCKKLKLKRYLQKYIKFQHQNQKYQTAEFILLLIYIIIAGIERIENTKYLGSNGVIKKILGLSNLPDPTAIRRFLYRLTPKAIRQIVQVHNLIQKKVFCILHTKTSIIFDIDGSVLTVFGKQSHTKIGFNPKRKGARSYMFMFCFESNREFWYGSLKHGNVSQVKVAPHIIKSCLDKLPYPIYRIRLRGDAVFYSHSFIEEFLEPEGIGYVIDVPMGKHMIPLMEKAEYSRYKGNIEVSEFTYQSYRWKKPHRYVMQRRPLSEDPEERAQYKLFEYKKYGYRVLVTNLKIKPQYVWNFYSQRAQGAEQNIKELKLNYPLARIPTKSYTANVAYFQILLLAFNITNWFKWLCLPKDYHYATLQTIREHLLFIQARLCKTDNRNIIKFPAEHKYKDLFNTAMLNIKKLKIA